jgi:uncharacterized coiled-coil protein SlyX
MSYDEDLSRLHKRLDDLERRLAEKEAAIAKAGALSSHDRRRVEELYDKARISREKLLASERSTWDAVKHDLEADWDALSGSFDHWVEQVDARYRQGRS